MTIAAASEHDVSSLAALSIEVWIGTYLAHGVSPFFADYALSEFTPANFKAILKSPNETILVSRNIEGIDGYVRLSFDSPDPVNGSLQTEIKTLYVQPRHQKRGIGRHLLKAACKLCNGRASPAPWLTVNAENSRAIRFYRAQGFVEIGETAFEIEERSYPNLVMAKSL